MAETNNTIRFGDRPSVIQDGSSTFKVIGPGATADSANRYDYKATPSECIYNFGVDGLKGRFLHLKSMVDTIFGDLSFLSEAKHEYLKPEAMLAILAVENGPRAKPSPEDAATGVGTGMLYIDGNLSRHYNPRVTSPALALSIPQVTRFTGFEYGNNIKDPWNYAESIRAGTNHFNVTLNRVSISGDRDATLLTAAMAYNQGFKNRQPIQLWQVKETKGYAEVFYQAYNQVLHNYYPSEGKPIDYLKYVDNFKLDVKLDV